MSQRQAAETLLVVDDEPTIRELLSATLRFAGFTVTSVPSGAEAVAAAVRERPALVLLDVMLPDIDGFEVARRIRAEARDVPSERATPLPILFLTARGEAEDRIRGFELGGDDYVTKPFNLDELIHRIRAILRRTGGYAASGTLVVGDLELDTEGHEVRRGGVPVRLSPTEFRLLQYLMANEGQVVSKLQILDHVWGYDFGGETGNVDSYISYLRRKVDAAPPRLIQTVYGVGYVLRRPRP